METSEHEVSAPAKRNVETEDHSAPLERGNRRPLPFYKRFTSLGRNQNDPRSTYNPRFLSQAALVLTAAIALKYFYSTASVNELRWILAPTTCLVELISGQQFHFESYAGYMNRDHTVVIAASCAGVNFLLTAYLMLALRIVWRSRGRNLKWRSLGLVAVIAYSTTIIANTFRITTALELRALRFESGWLGANELHRLEGIFVYFGFLLLLYVLTERLSDTIAASGQITEGGALMYRRLGFPLAIYYATTLGLPFLNGAFRQAEFWQHSIFVLLAPLVVLAPLALTLIVSRRVRAIKFS